MWPCPGPYFHGHVPALTSFVYTNGGFPQRRLYFVKQAFAPFWMALAFQLLLPAAPCAFSCGWQMIVLFPRFARMCRSACPVFGDLRLSLFENFGQRKNGKPGFAPFSLSPAYLPVYVP